MAIGINLDDDTDYYGSENSNKLVNRVILSNSDIVDLADAIAVAIGDYEDSSSLDAYYEIAYNKIHEKYGI